MKKIEDFGNFNFKDFIKDTAKLIGVSEKDIHVVSQYGDFSWDIEIDYENDDYDTIGSYIAKNSKYKDFIFDNTYATNEVYLSMPIVRAIEIGKIFIPKILKKNEDSLMIGDKNSNLQLWIDVWYDDEYPIWEYNQDSFNLRDYNDLVIKYLQQDENIWYKVDELVGDTFPPLTEGKKKMQTGLGMAQQLPTNSIYDGEIDEID